MTRIFVVISAVLAILLSTVPMSFASECVGPTPPGTINTVAGGGDLGDGGPALEADLGFPPGLATDNAGNLYIGDETAHTVRKVDQATGQITSIAGISNDAGFSGDGGLATEAEFNLPSGVAVDFQGNIYIADRQNHRIRRVDGATGIVETIAGNGIADYNGDGILATEASLRLPVEVGLDRAGNVYIADQYNQRVRKVDAATGLISIVAGTGAPGYNGDDKPGPSAQLNLPASVLTDRAGNVYIADKANHRIRRVDIATGKIRTIAGTGVKGYSGDGGPARNARLSDPAGLAWDPDGNLYVSDENNNVIRKIEKGTLIITTFVGSGGFGFGGDGQVATHPSVKMILPTGFATPGIAFDLARNFYFVDRGNQRVRRVAATTNVVSTVAGGGDPGNGIAATDATFVVPAGAWIDAQGDMYVADRGNNVIRKIAAGADGKITGAADEIVTNFAGTGVSGFSGDGGLATNARMMLPMAVIGSNNGHIYFTDQFNNRIRAVNLDTGIVRTVAGTSGGGFFDGDGGPATQAHINIPHGIAVDSEGNLFISDQFNNRIRRVSAGPDGIVNGGPAEIISTVAGTGAAGYTGNNLPATESRLNRPGIIATDQNNNLYLADKDSNLIRVVTPGADGVITGAPDEIMINVAGMPLVKGFGGDGGPATAARLNLPSGVGVDTNGNLYIGDFQNNVVRKVTPGADNVVNGGLDEVITTVAGIADQAGFEGDCGPATAAKLNLPLSVAIDDEENIYIGDVPNSRIRKVISPP